MSLSSIFATLQEDDDNMSVPESPVSVALHEADTPTMKQVQLPDSPSIKQQHKRRVSFDLSQNQVVQQEDAPRFDSQLWLQEADYVLIKYHRRLCLRRLELVTNQRRRQRRASLLDEMDQEYQHDDDEDETGEDVFWGLSSHAQAVAREREKRQSLQAVYLEQEAQQQEGSCRPDALADVYFDATFEVQWQAQERAFALRDELLLREEQENGRQDSPHENY